MDTFKVQLDVKNNAEELQKYYLDLNQWESDMKRKEELLKEATNDEQNYPPPRNKSKKEEIPSASKDESKISAYDYAAWDKFDVDKACSEMDGNYKSSDEIADVSLSKPSDNKLIDEAFYEKDLGNSYVKKGNWTDAIKCYSRAIKCDPSNPIFYANRALCFLKTKDFKSSETDSTTAIQLDASYVKAYQRRALVRTVLGQLEEAKADYKEILKLEPSNKSALLELDKINKKLESMKVIPKTVSKNEKIFDPKNIFTKMNVEETTRKVETFNHKNMFATQERKCKSINKEENCKTEDEKVEVEVDKCTKNENENGKKTKETQNAAIPWYFSGEHKIIHPISKPPHSRSKKPLKRILIREIGEFENDISSVAETPGIKPESPNIIQNKESTPDSIQSTSGSCKPEAVISEELLTIPKTSVQFNNIWKQIQHSPQLRYTFLKIIPADSIPLIFQNYMESGIFSEIIQTLATDVVLNDMDLIASLLSSLTQVKRFGALVMFMTNDERKVVQQCLDMVEKSSKLSEVDIKKLRTLYEI